MKKQKIDLISGVQKVLSNDMVITLSLVLLLAGITGYLIAMMLAL